MAASTRGPILVAIAGAVLAGILAAGYFLYFGPKKAKQAAQAEVEELAPKWGVTRSCLIGKSPLSSDVGEALILRELTARDVVAKHRECEPLLKLAERTSEFRTDNEALEAAWESFRLGRAKLAKALAHRTARRPRRTADELRLHLADGIRAAEGAYAALRAEVGLEKDAVDGEPLATAKRTPITPELAGSDFAQLELENNRIVAVDASVEPRRLYVLSDGKQQSITLRRGVFVAAAPPPGWGVMLEDGALSVVSLDPAEEIEPIALGKVGENVNVVGAIGSDVGERLVVTVDYLAGGQATLYHSPALQAPFTAKKLTLSDPALLPVSALDLAFRRLILQAPRETLEFTEIEQATPRRFLHAGIPCYSATSSWWQTGLQLIHARGAEVNPVLGSEDMPWQVRACDDAQILGASDADSNGVSVRLCSQSSCPVSTNLPLPANGQKFVLIAPKRGPLIATEASGILLVWAPDDKGTGLAPSVAADLGDSEILGLVEWGGKLGAVIRTDGKVELAHLE